MKNRIAIRIAWLQLFLLFISIVPRDLVHELQGCDDTKDCSVADKSAGFVISELHHHCELMQLDAPLPFIPAKILSFAPEQNVICFIFSEKQFVIKAIAVSGSSRAPPVS